MTPFETLVLDRAASSPMLERTLAWAAINSGTANLAGLAAQADALAAAFGVLPGTLRLLDPAPADAIAPDGIPRALVFGRNIHLRVRPDAPVRILLTGHMDTVYPADSPFQAVAPQRNGAVIGPGVADMKGGLALMLAALEAIEDSPFAERLGYDVVINSDEETGSAGSAALIAQAAAGKRAALTFEPALPDGTLAGARPGSGNFSIVVDGVAAHAGRNPRDGRNALVAAADLALSLARCAKPGLGINPARIDGGGPNNVVPAQAVLRVNMRPADAEMAARGRAYLELLIDRVAEDHEVLIRLYGGFGRPPKPIDAGAEALFGLVRDCGSDLGLPIAWAATGGVCDGNNIAAAGVPVVDTMGARGGAIHSPEEFLIVDSLAERARLSALVLMRLAQGALA